jgi:hypothetical protein
VACSLFSRSCDQFESIILENALGYDFFFEMKQHARIHAMQAALIVLLKI